MSGMAGSDAAPPRTGTLTGLRGEKCGGSPNTFQSTFPGRYELGQAPGGRGGAWELCRKMRYLHRLEVRYLHRLEV